MIPPTGITYKYLEADVYTFSFFSKPVKLDKFKASSHFVVREWLLDDGSKTKFDEIIDTIPKVEELIKLFGPDGFLIVTDFGDGRFEIETTDDILVVNDDGTFVIDHDNVIDLGGSVYSVESL